MVDVCRISISFGKHVGAWGARGTDVLCHLCMWACDLRVNALVCGPRRWVSSTSGLKAPMSMSRSVPTDREVNRDTTGHTSEVLNDPYALS